MDVVMVRLVAVAVEDAELALDLDVDQELGCAFQLTEERIRASL
jgi:hypothetical protein